MLVWEAEVKSVNTSINRICRALGMNVPKPIEEFSLFQNNLTETNSFLSPCNPASRPSAFSGALSPLLPEEAHPH